MNKEIIEALELVRVQLDTIEGYIQMVANVGQDNARRYADYALEHVRFSRREITQLIRKAKGDDN